MSYHYINIDEKLSCTFEKEEFIFSCCSTNLFMLFRLQEEESKNRTLEHKKPSADTRSNGATSGNGTLKRRVPSYVSFYAWPHILHKT